MALYQGAFRECGDSTIVYPNALILKPEMISLGVSCRIDDYARLEGGEGLTIGDYTHISSFASILAGGTCILGRYVGMAQGSKIITGTGFPFEEHFDVDLHPDDPYIRRVMENFVGDYAIIACNAVVLPGVRVGEGAVVAANSVATKDVPPWTIVAGTPARILKARPRPLSI